MFYCKPGCRGPVGGCACRDAALAALDLPSDRRLRLSEEAAVNSYWRTAAIAADQRASAERRPPAQHRTPAPATPPVSRVSAEELHAFDAEIAAAVADGRLQEHDPFTSTLRGVPGGLASLRAHLAVQPTRDEMAMAVKLGVRREDLILVKIRRAAEAQKAARADEESRRPGLTAQERKIAHAMGVDLAKLAGVKAARMVQAAEERDVSKPRRGQ